MKERMYWVLKGREPVEVNDLEEWAKAFESRDRHVGNDICDGVRVSTVFLGIDHNFSPDGPPLLFETMIFLDDEKKYQHATRGSNGAYYPNPVGRLGGYQYRTSTYEEAEAHHAEALRLLRSALAQLEQISRKKSNG